MRLVKSRYLLAAFGGLCLALSFPNANVAGLAWVAPALIVFAAHGSRGWESFRVGYVAGLAHYLVSLNWLLAIPYRWHGIPLAPAAGWLSLGAFLSLLTGTWVWLVVRAAGGASPTWLGRTGWALYGAAAWVALEMLITRLFGGFPWNLLGASQFGLTPLIQIASFTGIYGVSFVVAWTSLCLFSAGAIIVRRPTARSQWPLEVILPTLAIVILIIAGFRTLRDAPNPTESLRLTLIQPSIPQTVIWDEQEDDVRFQRLLDLCGRALTNRTDLLIWPEAAVPKLLRYDEATFKAVTGLAQSNRVWMIVGADDAEPRRETPDPKDADFFNSSFLISPDGELVSEYRKRSLVIFGEYIPLSRWLPFLGWFTPIRGGFAEGDKAVQFSLSNLQAQASVLICFEDVFPQIARSSVEPKTDFLVNITNDGWFGEGSAQWQQAVTGLFRAVENRRPLIRCTNNGLTCWIDAYGRIREIFQDANGRIFGEGFMTFELPLFSPGSQPHLTFYNRHGDVFGWVCSGIALLFLAGDLMPWFRRGQFRARR